MQNSSALIHTNAPKTASACAMVFETGFLSRISVRSFSEFPNTETGNLFTLWFSMITVVVKQLNQRKPERLFAQSEEARLKGRSDGNICFSRRHTDVVMRQFPEAAWQRCQYHFLKNISDKVPKKYRAGICSELQELFTSNGLEEARHRKDENLADYSDIAEEAM